MGIPFDTGRFADADPSDVSTHADAAALVRQMLADLRAYPSAWENATLDRFLGALAVIFDTLPALYADRGEQFPDQPTWKLLAEALVAASGYE